MPKIHINFAKIINIDHVTSQVYSYYYLFYLLAAMWAVSEATFMVGASPFRGWSGWLVDAAETSLARRPLCNIIQIKTNCTNSSNNFVCNQHCYCITAVLLVIVLFAVAFNSNQLFFFNVVAIIFITNSSIIKICSK